MTPAASAQEQAGVSLEAGGKGTSGTGESMALGDRTADLTAASPVGMGVGLVANEEPIGQNLCDVYRLHFLPDRERRAADRAMRLRRISKLLALVVALGSFGAEAAPIVERTTLENGLEVMVLENQVVPLVTIEVAVKAGSMVETAAQSGLSHLYEHMFFRSNRALPSQEAVEDRTYELGIVNGGRTTAERVNYFLTTTSNHLEEAMVFMRDALLFPLFTKEDFERERQVVLAELDLRQSDPIYHLYRSINERVWWKYPLRKLSIGNRSSLLAATTADLRDLGQSYYIPNNAVLIVTGDVKAHRIFRQANELFRGWKRGPDPFEQSPLVKHPPLLRTEVVMVSQPVEFARGALVWQGPSLVANEIELTYAAELLELLLQDPSAEFQKRLVAGGPCGGPSLHWDRERNVGPITLQFNASFDDVDACLKSILSELGKMASSGYFPEEALRRAKRNYRFNAALESESPSQVAHEIGLWWATAGVDHYLNRTTKMDEVDTADIGRLIERYLFHKPYVLAVMLSPEKIAAGLNRAHFERLIGVQRTE
jgi:zinc protease